MMTSSLRCTTKTLPLSLLTRPILFLFTIVMLATMQSPPAAGCNSRKETPGRGAVGRSLASHAKGDLAAVTAAYLEAVAQQQFDGVSNLLDPNVEFTTSGRVIHGPHDLIVALKEIAPILVRNDIKKIFVDGNQVCVIYDFVTNTSVGVLPSVEWITFRDGKIASVQLIFHTAPWHGALEELKKRTQPTS